MWRVSKQFRFCIFAKFLVRAKGISRISPHRPEKLRRMTLRCSTKFGPKGKRGRLSRNSEKRVDSTGAVTCQTQCQNTQCDLLPKASIPYAI